LRVNCAPTVVLTVRVITQDPVPAHGADHPVKFEVPLGVAVSVTTVPDAKLAVQVEPQLIPAGLLITVPPPDPDLVTVRVIMGTVLNVATTV